MISLLKFYSDLTKGRCNNLSTFSKACNYGLWFRKDVACRLDALLNASQASQSDRFPVINDTRLSDGSLLIMVWENRGFTEPLEEFQ